MSSQDDHFNFTPEVAAPTPPSSRKKKYGFRAERIVKRRADYRQKKVARRRDERASKRLKEIEISAPSKDEFAFGSQESTVSSLRDDGGSAEEDDEEEGRDDIQPGSDDGNTGHEDFGGGGGDLDYSDGDSKDGRSCSSDDGGNGKDIETMEEGDPTANLASETPSRKRKLNNDGSIESNAARAIKEANSTLSKRRKQCSSGKTDCGVIDLAGSSSSSSSSDEDDDDDDDEKELRKPIRKPVALANNSTKRSLGNIPERKNEGTKPANRTGEKEDKGASSIDGDETARKEGTQANATAKTDAQTSSKDGDDLGNVDAGIGPPDSSGQASLPAMEISTQMMEQQINDIEMEMAVPNLDKHSKGLSKFARDDTEDDDQCAEHTQNPGSTEHASHFPRGTKNADSQFTLYGTIESSTRLPATQEIDESNSTKATVNGNIKTPKKKRVTSKLASSFPATMSPLPDGVRLEGRHSQLSRFSALTETQKSIQASLQTQPVLDSHESGDKSAQKNREPGAASSRSRSPSCEDSGNGARAAQAVEKSDMTQSEKPRGLTDVVVVHDQYPAKQGLPDGWDLRRNRSPQWQGGSTIDRPAASVRGKTFDPAKLALVQIARCAVENVTASIDATDRGRIPAEQRDSLVKAARDMIRALAVDESNNDPVIRDRDVNDVTGMVDIATDAPRRPLKDTDFTDDGDKY